MNLNLEAALRDPLGGVCTRRLPACILPVLFCLHPAPFLSLLTSHTSCPLCLLACLLACILPWPELASMGDSLLAWWAW